MAPQTEVKSSRLGLSLYANLLDPSSDRDSAPGTISRAPVVFQTPNGGGTQQDQAAAEKQQINAAALRFQPTKRPQLAAPKSRQKSSLQRAPAPASGSHETEPNIAESTHTTIRSSAKTTLADWAADGEDINVNGFDRGEKRPRGGRKKRKKNKEDSHIPQNWDDIYDPSRPNNYDDYKHSDEKIMEMREWKNRLYAHRMLRRCDSDSNSSTNDYKFQTNERFAPPIFDASEKAPGATLVTGVPNDPTGSDVYDRRMHIPQLRNQDKHLEQTPDEKKAGLQPLLPPSSSSPPPPPPPPPSTTNESDLPQQPPPQPINIGAAASISKAPVRYNLPAVPSDLHTAEVELEDGSRDNTFREEIEEDTAPRSLRPGQKGFAERLMSKYGWNKGSGLGANGSGIVNPLRVQVEKQKRKPDSEGGGLVGPGGRGKIIGGKKNGGAGAEMEEGKFGAMSDVVILRGMVDGMDLDVELEGSSDGGLMQEIGEECEEKYGRVERVFIDRNDRSIAPVFVKFTSQLSALRAVNALEGRLFNGNTIVAKFYDSDKFEAGIFG